MAGIGFRLQRILSKNTYSSTLKAYAFSSLIMAGPMILTILTLTFIHWASLDTLSFHEQNYLRALVTYCFAFSFLAIGPFQLVVTRYLADEYYRRHVTHYTASFFSCLAVCLLMWAPLTLLYFSTLYISWGMKLNAFLLFSFVTGNWLALIFLSAAKDYTLPIWAFFAASVLSGVTAYALGSQQGLPGYFAGMTLGQGLAFVILSLAIVKEFGYEEARDTFWMSYWKKYPYLLGIGVCYNMGIWADKVLFWMSSEGELLDKFLRYSLIYDNPMFLSYLTVLPSLSFFLIQMETGFFFKFQAYFKDIQNQRNLNQLEKRRTDMVVNLEQSLTKLFIFQLIISGLAILCVPWIAQTFRMDPIYMGILRTGIFASFLQVGFMILLLILMYFDAQKEAFIAAFFFFSSNLFFTHLSLEYGLPAYGFGFTLSCFCSLILTYNLLHSRLRHLHYWTFMKQPLFRPVFISEDAED